MARTALEIAIENHQLWLDTNDKENREVLVVYGMQSFCIYTESEFLKQVGDNIEDFFDSCSVFVIKNGKFHEISEDDVEINPKLKV